MLRRFSPRKDKNGRFFGNLPFCRYVRPAGARSFLSKPWIQSLLR